MKSEVKFLGFFVFIGKIMYINKKSYTMTIKYLREILKHYEDPQYDDWNVTLFDYNNQRVLHVNDGTYASSKDKKSITFTVDVEPVDGETIDKRIKRLMAEIEKQKEEWNSMNQQKDK